ncbi:hypothetical protein [Roseomonas rosulenta]|uniref:hypothetical protein n=1 Tax=Roseomonas rosulenta TaxID=2748667 RepID=UPI0018E0385F|nr:hypothetical protein [Roseomonas rosulenta]
MNTLLFLASLIGIAWLCVWSVLPRPGSSKGWWPFDMRGDAPAEEAVQDGPPRRGARPAHRAWRAQRTGPP